MNENNMPVITECEASVITSVPQSSNTNDIIDLTEINEWEEHSGSVIVSHHSARQFPSQGPGKPSRNRRRTNSNSSENNPTKARSESMDDSISILYENLHPPPEIVVVNEVIIDGREHNQSDDIDILSYSVSSANPVSSANQVSTVNQVSVIDQVSTVVVSSSSFMADPIFDLPEIPPLFPEISTVRISSYQPINYSMDNQIVAPDHSSLPSCKYATVTNERPGNVPGPTGLQRLPLATTQLPLNSKPVPYNAPGSGLEKPDITIKVPKIQCGICLDGPDEIAASDRMFTSTNCGHVFCNDCIKTSMKNAAKCPKCRKKITSRSIHPLYL